jgi:uncharacterized Zn finger protein
MHALEVAALDVSRGLVRASVRGPNASRCEVTIRLQLLPAAVWRRALRAMASRASFAASLLSGSIPADIETAFAGSSRTLLPQSPEELRNACTCDADGFCSHLALVHDQLGRRFDQDPFLIFLLRGKERAELLKAIRQQRKVLSPAESAERPVTHAPVEPSEPLPGGVLEKPELFFKPLVPVASLRTTFAPPEQPEAILTRLGPPPLQDPEAARLLMDLHRAIGLGAEERLSEWEWRRAGKG